MSEIQPKLDAAGNVIGEIEAPLVRVDDEGTPIIQLVVAA